MGVNSFTVNRYRFTPESSFSEVFTVYCTVRSSVSGYGIKKLVVITCVKIHIII